MGKKSYCVASSRQPSFSKARRRRLRFLTSRSFLHSSLAFLRGGCYREPTTRVRTITHRKWFTLCQLSRCIVSNASYTHSRSAHWISHYTEDIRKRKGSAKHTCMLQLTSISLSTSFQPRARNTS
jgi:hypothetical protein